jgi:hypothetical protein
MVDGVVRLRPLPGAGEGAKVASNDGKIERGEIRLQGSARLLRIRLKRIPHDAAPRYWEPIWHL